MPPIPSFPIFLLILSLGLISSILTIIYYLKARNYKKELDDYKHHLNNACATLTKPTNSAPEMTTANSQSSGKGTKRKIEG